MEKQSGQDQNDKTTGGVIFLGTTTLRFMLSAVYDEDNPLNKHFVFSECGGARLDVEDDPSLGDDTVYVYYHPKRNRTIMTNAQNDFYGGMGSSAGFVGKLDLKTQTIQ